MWKEISDVVTPIVAVYGAIRSTIDWLRIRKDDKRSFNVRLSVYKDKAINADRDGDILQLKITSTSKRKVIIDRIYCVPRGERPLIIKPRCDQNLPHASDLPTNEISDGGIAFVYFSSQDIAQALKEGQRTSELVFFHVLDSTRPVDKPYKVNSGGFITPTGRYLG